MSEQDKLAREMTRYIDGLMSPDEEARFLHRVEGDPELRAELAAQQGLKEVTDVMSMTKMPDEHWDTYWHGVYKRIERGAGWLFFSAGVIIVAAFAGYHLFMDFFLNAEVSLLARVGVGVGSLGAIILLVSVCRERLFAHKHERYKEVER